MRTLLFLWIAVFVAAPARADLARDALTEITKCADIVDSSERLKCFDAAVAGARSALAAPAPEPPKKGFLEWFGLSRPQAPVTKTEDFGKPAPPLAPGTSEEITEIKATVIEFARTLRGKALFVLDNGQVWRQIDADGTELPDPAPDATIRVTIETGALGSYNLTVDGRSRSIKVNRLK